MTKKRKQKWWNENEKKKLEKSKTEGLEVMIVFAVKEKKKAKLFTTLNDVTGWH